MDRENPFAYIESCVEASGYELDRKCYQEIRRLFVDRFASSPIDLGKFTTELGKSEFLACVNNDGTILMTPSDIVDDYKLTLEQYPDFENWFREVVTAQSEARVLLVSRWLYHLIGFRHLSVHLFIDIPNTGNLTLIQVRSANRAKSTGCFDLPVSGHRENLDSIEKTLATELKEETGLQVDDIDGLQIIGEFAFSAVPKSLDYPDNEYRVVYRCRLKEFSKLYTLRIPQGEVAKGELA